MNDTPRVNIVERTGNLAEIATDLGQAERSATNARSQQATRHKRHDNVILAEAIEHALTHIIDRHQAGVMQRGHQSRLADKALEHLFVIALKDFYRHDTLEMRIIAL